MEPEAAALLEKLKGEKYLVFVSDKYSNYKDFIGRMNHYLREIGPSVMVLNAAGTKKNKRKVTPLFPDITTYWSRHTWATLAHKHGIQLDDISLALGHSFGSKTTRGYVEFEQEKIDVANRKVIDELCSTSSEEEAVY